MTRNSLYTFSKSTSANVISHMVTAQNSLYLIPPTQSLLKTQTFQLSNTELASSLELSSFSVSRVCTCTCPAPPPLFLTPRAPNIWIIFPCRRSPAQTHSLRSPILTRQWRTFCLAAPPSHRSGPVIFFGRLHLDGFVTGILFGFPQTFVLSAVASYLPVRHKGEGELTHTHTHSACRPQLAYQV